LKPAFELAQVIERFGRKYAEQYNLNGYVLKTLSAIRCCRTASLGGHVDRCDTCGHIRISYNSCRNRHCPKCQNTQREAWIEERKQDLLPVPYFHVVFTVPDKLNPLFMADSAAMYNLLFRSVWETMNRFFFSRLQAEGGMIAVLHTWGQNLSLHPHIHCIVPGGGIGMREQWKSVAVSESGKVFLFPVKAISTVFKAKLMTSLRKSSPLQSDRIKAAWNQDWVVYTKEPFAGPASVVEYLGRYTHKIAISNHRILGISDQQVTFRWRDYRDNRQKIMALDGTEFLRRYCQHILPSGFVRIRYYGLLSATRKDQFRELQVSMGLVPSPSNKKKIRKPWKDLCREHLNYDPDQCPNCKTGRMIQMERFTPLRGPPLLIHPNKTTKP
jgi:hypothetical protein